MSQCFNIVYLAIGFTAGQLAVAKRTDSLRPWVSVYTKWPAKAAVGTNRTSYGQKIETAQRRQRSNIFGLGPVLHNKLAVDA
jgi:hypothetical protein